MNDLKIYYSSTSEKPALNARISAFFIAVRFENYERYFFMKF